MCAAVTRNQFLRTKTEQVRLTTLKKFGRRRSLTDDSILLVVFVLSSDV